MKNLVEILERATAWAPTGAAFIDGKSLSTSADRWRRSLRLAAGVASRTGRLRDLITCGGENILPQEVEEVLLRHPAVAEAAVVGTPDPVRGEVPRAIVAFQQGQAVEAVELIEFCRQHLAGFKVPMSIEFRPQLPRTPIGRSDRRALRQHLGDPLGGQAPPPPPPSPGMPPAGEPHPAEPEKAR